MKNEGEENFTRTSIKISLLCYESSKLAFSPSLNNSLSAVLLRNCDLTVSKLYLLYCKLEGKCSEYSQIFWVRFIVIFFIWKKIWFPLNQNGIKCCIWMLQYYVFNLDQMSLNSKSSFISNIAFISKAVC